MNDKELADRIVALGIGVHNPESKWPYSPPECNIGDNCKEDDFVRDWRVAGALMEKWWETELPMELEIAHMRLPIVRSICEACVEALSDESP